AAAWPGETVELLSTEVKVGHLPCGVHAGVCSPRHDQCGGGREAAEDDGERRLDLTLYGSHARLPGPAGEIGAVVGDVQADARGRVVVHAPILLAAPGAPRTSSRR